MPVTRTIKPASSTSASGKSVLSLVIASSIFLSSTRIVETSMLVLEPSTVKLPVIRMSPVKSSVCAGVLFQIPTLLFVASI